MTKRFLLSCIATALLATSAMASTLTIQPLGQVNQATINCDDISWYQVEYVSPPPTNQTVDIHFGAAVLKADNNQNGFHLTDALAICLSTTPRHNGVSYSH